MANNKNIEILRTVTFSQGDYTKSVAENKRDFFQDILDKRFEYATDYLIIKEETFCGSTEYSDIEARVTHAVSSGLTENFANEIKKIIFRKYTHEQYLGKMYQFNGAYWLTTNLNETTGLSSHSLVRKCNNTLKWVSPDGSGKVISVPCVFTKQFTSTSFDNGSQSVIQIDGDFMIFVQSNSLTKQISYNWRFVLNGHSFQVTQINNHLSDTLLILKIKEIDIQSTDNTTDNVANDVNAITKKEETKILPNETIKILLGETQDYSVYHYIDGIPSDETFDIVAHGLSGYYELTIIDGNNFRVKNLKQSNTPLVVYCGNTATGDMTSIEILLGGNW